MQTFRSLLLGTNNPFGQATRCKYIYSNWSYSENNHACTETHNTHVQISPWSLLKHPNTLTCGLNLNQELSFTHLLWNYRPIYIALLIVRIHGTLNGGVLNALYMIPKARLKWHGTLSKVMGWQPASHSLSRPTSCLPLYTFIMSHYEHNILLITSGMVTTKWQTSLQ